MSAKIAFAVMGILMMNCATVSGAAITTTTIQTESFDFSTNTHGGLGTVTGGDLYYLPQAGMDAFWANNNGQQGLQDIGPVPLTSITTIPSSGYLRSGVPTTIGHSYISLAQIGEPGFYIFLTVDSKTSDSVTIDWIYSNAAPGVPEPGSLALVAAGIVGLGLLRRGSLKQLIRK